jgi:plastocyanin
VACGSDSKVGEGVEIAEDGDASDVLGALRDTTTTSPPDLTEGGGGSATTAPPTTGSATTAPPTTEAQPAAIIKIQSDNTGLAFEPVRVRVPRGGIVRWENHDTVERSVEFSDNSFATGLIPPGGRFDYRADRAGTFRYTDGTRPYATAEIQVT